MADKTHQATLDIHRVLTTVHHHLSSSPILRPQGTSGTICHDLQFTTLHATPMFLFYDLDEKRVGT